MSRARMVRPEFWTDSKLARCSIPSRLLFIGLWTFADDYGNIEHDPVQIKLQVFPGDTVNTQELLSELISVGVIVPYSNGDRQYITIPKFAKHQYIKHKSNPRCPFPPDMQETLPTHDGSMSPQEKLKELELENQNLPTDTKPVSGYIVVGRKKRRKVPYSEDFQVFWSKYPRLLQKEVAYARWLQTIKEYPPADLILSAEIYAEKTTGKDERYLLHPATFLNKGRWKDYCIVHDDGKKADDDNRTGNENLHRGI